MIKMKMLRALTRKYSTRKWGPIEDSANSWETCNKELNLGTHLIAFLTQKMKVGKKEDGRKNCKKTFSRAFKLRARFPLKRKEGTFHIGMIFAPSILGEIMEGWALPTIRMVTYGPLNDDYAFRYRETSSIWRKGKSEPRVTFLSFVLKKELTMGLSCRVFVFQNFRNITINMK